MSLLSASNLAAAFGAVDIFSGVTLSIPPRARVALVGPNGIGKTTLLRILAREQAPDAGKVHWARGLRVGYLPQEAQFDSENSLWQECLEAFAALRKREKELEALERQLGGGEDEALLQKYGDLQRAFEVDGGYEYELRIRQTLGGLGFEERDYDLQLKHLSGGQRTRARLARLLLERPDLLILDEPTNHLDIGAVEWLEGYLRDWEGGALIVSHDRYFLDRVVDHVWEMALTGFEQYRGNYSAYLEQRDARWEERRQFVENERARLAKELDYVRRNIAGQRTSQAQGKLRRLSRQIVAIERHGFLGVQGKQWGEIGQSGESMRVEEAAQRLKGLETPEKRLGSLGLQMRARGRSGDIVLRAKDLEVGYPGRSLFGVKALELRRLECAALIGPNGAGKTTLLKTMLDEIPTLAGELKLGASLNIGYFAQAHEDLNGELTLIEEIDLVAPGMREAEIRGYLGRFLFSGDDQYKKVSVLSGGERGRLALAKLALSDANFLLLDEPTNHLDIPSQEVLQGVLAGFEGTILMVSHDRYLIDALATQLWVIDTEARRLEVFEGAYSEYRAAREAVREERGENGRGEAGMGEGEAREQGGRGAGVQGGGTSRLSKHELKRRQERLERLEGEIARLEEKLGEIGKKLENPPADPEEVRRLGEEYERMSGELEDLLRDWERLHREQQGGVI